MIKFLDLQKINAQYGKELKAAACDVIDSGQYILGEQTEQFEENLAKYIGVKYAIGVGNGFDALRLILRAYIEMGALCEGDEIIVPANTYIATILAITENRLIPMFVEPDINTYNLDISLIEEKISARTKAIMVVHLYGRPCWSKELETVAVKYELLIIEDNAQSIGAEYKSEKTGSLGDAAGMSFYPTKNLGALADAGAITTDNKTLARIVLSLRNYGSERKYVNEYKGINSRISEMQAAFLNIKLSWLNPQNRRRADIADYYCKNIKNESIILPKFSVNSVWHLFVIRTKNRVKLQQFLKTNGIETMIHYPTPAHKQKAYQGNNALSLPITEQLSREVLSLPISPVMEKLEIKTVIDVINRYEE